MVIKTPPPTAIADKDPIFNRWLVDVNTALAEASTEVTALTARGSVLNGTVPPDPALGSVNDWYANTVLLNIYVKTGVFTWTLVK